ncbi:MAG: hypothetical protein Q9159_000152 [Coniocarpon cinnabarinum]
MLEELDDLRREEPFWEHEIWCDQLLSRALDKLKTLRKWYEGDQPRHPLEDLLIPPFPNPEITPFNFTTLLVGHTFAIYHATLILLYTIVHPLLSLYPSLPATYMSTVTYSASFPHSSFPIASTYHVPERTHLTTSNVEAAIEISIDSVMASLPFHIAPSTLGSSRNEPPPHSPSLGAFFMITALKICQYPAWGKRREWLDTVLRRISETTKVEGPCSADVFTGVVGWKIATNLPWEERGYALFDSKRTLKWKESDA